MRGARREAILDRMTVRRSRTRWPARGAAAAVVLGAGALALAHVGDGSLTAQAPVAVVVVAGSGSAQGSDLLTNTTSGSFTVALAADAACDAGVTFGVSGNPASLAAGSSLPVTIRCAADQPPGFQRCPIHATRLGGAALADLLAVCAYASGNALVPGTGMIDFGSVGVGTTSAPVALALRNTGSAAFTHLSLQTTDLDGDFVISTPCPFDAPWCDADVPPVAPGSAATIYVACAPQAAGSASAQLRAITDGGQALAAPVALSCTGTATSAPALAVEPVALSVAAPLDAGSASATEVVHLTNAGGSNLVVSDVRVVDVDAGGAADWRYVASGRCSGEIAPACTLGPGDRVDLAVTFAPTAIASRRASLVLSYHDTLDRTRAIPLTGTGGGATLALVGPASIDLGTVPVGQTASVDVTLANRGTRATTAMLSLAPAGAPFATSPASSIAVPPGAPAEVTLRCTPTAAGSATTMLTAHAVDVFGAQDAMVTASCEGTTSPLHASPSTIVLGELPLGGSAVDTTVSLESTAGPLTLSGPPMLEDPLAELAVGSASSTTTPATFVVTAEPTAQGDLADHVLVNDTAGDKLRIPVSGSAVDPAYTVPTTLSLGTFCVGEPTTPSDLELDATGTGTVHLGAPQLAASPSPFELTPTAPLAYPAALAPGDHAILSLAPRRTTIAGQVSDTLTWPTGVPGAPTATVALDATFLDSGAAVAPPAIDFGVVAVHIFVQDARRVTLQNCSGVPLQLDPPAIAPPFSIDGPAAPTVLDPSAPATYLVGFHPARPGTFTGSLSITAHAGSGSATMLQVMLAGATPMIAGADAGTGTMTPPKSGCGCDGGGDPAGGLAIALAALAVIVRRRRGRNGSP